MTQDQLGDLIITCVILLSIILVFVNAIVIYYLIRVGIIRFKKKKSKVAITLKDRDRTVIAVDDISLFISNFATALCRLSSHKVGALMVFENRDNLQKYVELGSKVEANFLPELVYSIFYNHESALHDGAMIIRNMKIVSLSSYLPVTKRLLPVKYGARHRAAFGLAERTDAIAFVVSETTGAISMMYGPNVLVLPNESVKLADQLTTILFDKYYLFASNKSSAIMEMIKERIN